MIQSYRTQAPNSTIARHYAYQKYPNMKKIIKVEVLIKATNRTVGDYRVYFER